MALCILRFSGEMADVVMANSERLCETQYVCYNSSNSVHKAFSWLLQGNL